MLFSINRGNTGRPPGCQYTIVHLVSTLAAAMGTGRLWAVSSGNAGAYHTTFDDQLMAVAVLDWEAIRATQWAGRQHQKQAELLVADFFPWSAINSVGCHNSVVASQVTELFAGFDHRPVVQAQPGWYYE